MKQLIDKSAVVAEIENFIDKSNYYDNYNCAFRDGNNAALYALKVYINTLEVKEANSTDAFIEKACEWLENNLLNYWQQVNTDSSKFIEDFRKAMEE